MHGAARTAVSQKRATDAGRFCEDLESTGWMKHIKLILDAVALIVHAVGSEGACVLVHCSDGWDRTAQLTSLAEICLEPHCRTIGGLQAVIEREWLYAGHKFSQRCGFLTSDRRETSPIFTQFLDCVHQLMQQFPGAFEVRCARTLGARGALTPHPCCRVCRRV